MADKKISELVSITGANTAADDYFVVVDTSGAVTYKISREELNNAIEQDVLENISITNLTSDLNTNGNNINFGDSDKAIFGAGSDLQIYHDGSNSIINDAGAGSLKFQYGGTDGVVFDSSGNVGIGTSSPNSYAGYTALTLNHATNGGIIDIERNGTVVGEIFTDDVNTFTLQAVGSKSVNFRTNGSEAMRIDSSGNVGIGTSSPATSYGKVLQIHSATTGANLRLTDSVSGSGTGNGFEIIQIGADNYLLNRENGFVSIWTNNSEKMRILSTGGITFNGDTAQANALDDYEEATWTPVLTDGTNTANVGAVGRVTKIGRHVTATCGGYGFDISSFSSGAAITITGLPFSPNGSDVGATFIHITGTAGGANIPVVVYTTNGSGTLVLYKALSTGPSVAQLIKSDLANSVSVRFSLSYITT